VLPFSLNHMTVNAMPYSSLLDTAKALDCVGIELRNDLTTPLFDGATAELGGIAATNAGLRIFAIAEICAFNYFTDDTRARAIALMDAAATCGAQGIALIPRCDGQGTEQSMRVKSLEHALTELKPLLAERSLTGFVEPLGFEQSSLRFKSEAVDAINACDARGEFQLVHDTFHHYLAGGGPFFPDMTGMVHVSGVIDTTLALQDIKDEHRVLVNEHDRMGNIPQLKTLVSDGYAGPISMEAFSPAVHALKDPASALSESFKYITSAINAGSDHASNA